MLPPLPPGHRRPARTTKKSGPRGGMLKGVTCAHLKRHPAVQAFCSALPRDGGNGALYVLLKRGRGGRRR